MAEVWWRRIKVKKNLLLGIAVLLFVDILWVGSAALSRYLFTTNYDKPFFTTYFKTSLFSIYLSAFIFWRPWQRLCKFPQKRRPLRNRLIQETSASTTVTNGSCDHVQESCDYSEKKACDHMQVKSNGSCDLTETGPSGSCDHEHRDVTGSCDHIEDTETSKINDHTEARTDDFNESISTEMSNESRGRIKVEVHFESCDRAATETNESCDHVETVTNGSCDRIEIVTNGSYDHVETFTNGSCDRGETSNGYVGTDKLKETPRSCDLEVPLGTGQRGETEYTGSIQASDSDKCDWIPQIGVRDIPSCLKPSCRAHRHTFVPRSPHTCSNPGQGNNASLQATTAAATAATESGKTPLKFRAFPGELDKCPLPEGPKLDVCLLGPPEFQPLACYEVDDSDQDTMNTEAPLSPCPNRCCKVRFKRTIEVREMQGRRLSLSLSSIFGKKKDFKAINKQERSGPVQLLPVYRVVPLSLCFGILWFFANYLYGRALEKTSVAVVNTLSATSGVFVMILAGIPFLTVTEGDKFTLPRCLVTLISFSGAILVALSPSGKEKPDEDTKFNTAAVLALGGAILYALYLVLLRRCVKEPEALEIPMFFGFVGLFDFVLLLPLLVIWHYTKLELFELPPTPNVWTLLLVNGFVGTVLSELLWLWGVFLTSPLLGTLALSLVTPLSIAYSIIIGKTSFSWMFLLGAVLIILAFVGVAILEHLGAWDPIWAGLKKLFRLTLNCILKYNSGSPESEQLLSREQSPDFYIPGNGP